MSEAATTPVESLTERDARMRLQRDLANRMIAAGYSYRSAYRIARNSYPTPTK